MLEEDRRRAIQQWPAQSLRPADDVDESTLVQRLQYTADRDATNLFDLGATDRLSIRHDRQCLQRRSRKPVWARRQLSALDRLGVFGTSEDLPPSSNLLQLYAVTVDVVVLA